MLLLLSAAAPIACVMHAVVGHLLNRDRICFQGYLNRASSGISKPSQLLLHLAALFRNKPFRLCPHLLHAG